MLSTSIGVLFIICGVLWGIGGWLAGGMTEYRSTWRDTPEWTLWAVSIVMLGVALVWR